LDVADEEDVGLEPLDIACALSESDVRDASRGERGAGSSDRSTRVAFEGTAVDRSITATEEDTADGAEFGTKIPAGGAARVFGAIVDTETGASSGRKCALSLEFEVGLATIGASRNVSFDAGSSTAR
jgi:hypothetical protein